MQENVIIPTPPHPKPISCVASTMCSNARKRYHPHPTPPQTHQLRSIHHVFRCKKTLSSPPQTHQLRLHVHKTPRPSTRRVPTTPIYPHPHFFELKQSLCRNCCFPPYDSWRSSEVHLHDFLKEAGPFNQPELFSKAFKHNEELLFSSFLTPARSLF